MRTFREAYPPMTVAQAHILLVLAQKASVSETQISLATGLDKKRVARNVVPLSIHGSLSDGVNLVHIDRDPRDRRRRIYALTSHGAVLCQRLSEIRTF